MGETEIMNQVQLEASRMGARLFRNNVGLGWAGRLIAHRGGFVTLENARPLHAGLVVGSSDLIGWTPVEITSKMVGERLAVFTAIEVKAPKGRVTPEQENFLRCVKLFGGTAALCRDPDELKEILGPIAHVDVRVLCR